MRIHRVGAFVVQSDHRQITGFPDAGVDRMCVRDMFFHGVLPWVLQRGPWDCLHASAVLTELGVVAFCGHPCRGKSTLARAWTERGAVPYADDTVPFLIREGLVLSASLPQKLRLREPAASRFSERSSGADEGLPGPDIRCDLRPSLRPLCAIYAIEPMLSAWRQPAAVVTPVAPVEALPLMLSFAHCMSLRDAECNRKMVRNYFELARHTPVFRLAFARDLDRLPGVLDVVEENQRKLPAASGTYA